MRVMQRAVIEAIVLAASVAAADPAADAFAEGQKRYDAGEYLVAADRFEAAYALDPDPAYLFNIAQAYRFGNACAKAAASYRKFLGVVPNAPNAAKVQQYIEQSDDCAKKQAAAQRPPPPPDRPIVQPPPPPPPEHPSGHPGRTQRIAGLGIAGAGVIGIGVAAFFTWKTADYASQREELCKAEIAATGMCQWTEDREAKETDLQDKGDSAALKARIAWGVGGAALVGGIVLYLLAPSGSAEQPSIAITPTRDGAMAYGSLRF